MEGKGSYSNRIEIKIISILKDPVLCDKIIYRDITGIQLNTPAFFLDLFVFERYQISSVLRQIKMPFTAASCPYCPESFLKFIPKSMLIGGKIGYYLYMYIVYANRKVLSRICTT